MTESGHCCELFLSQHHWRAFVQQQEKMMMMKVNNIFVEERREFTVCLDTIQCARKSSWPLVDVHFFSLSAHLLDSFHIYLSLSPQSFSRLCMALCRQLLLSFFFFLWFNVVLVMYIRFFFIFCRWIFIIIIFTMTWPLRLFPSRVAAQSRNRRRRRRCVVVTVATLERH